MALASRGVLIGLAVAVPIAAVAAVAIGYRGTLQTVLGGEAGAIAASHGLVSRAGPVLGLTLDSGAQLALTDRLQCGDLPCPDFTATQYRYQGWDGRAGGYKLAVGLDHPAAMTLAWALANGDPALFNANDINLSGSTLAMPRKPAPAAVDPSLAEWLTNTARDQDKVEGPRLAASGGHAARRGANLQVTLADGRKLVFADDILCGQLVCPPEIYIGYEYRGADPTGRYHAIEEHFYETGAAFLVDARSGGITRLAGPVAFSPDGARAVATMNDPQPHGQHDIEIWSLAGEAPALEYCYVGDGEDTYEVTRWDGPDRIRLTRGKWQSDTRAPVTLIHDTTGWHSPAANCR